MIPDLLRDTACNALTRQFRFLRCRSRRFSILVCGVFIVRFRARGCHAECFLFRSPRIILLLSEPPSVPLPKYEAIVPSRPFRLFDGSFESTWQLILHRTSLNVQIAVVLEMYANQVVRSGVAANISCFSVNFAARKRLKITN